MATLRKYETVTDVIVYEVELTDEQLALYNEDEDLFWEKFDSDLDWDFAYDKAGDPELEFELKE